MLLLAFDNKTICKSCMHFKCPPKMRGVGGFYDIINPSFFICKRKSAFIHTGTYYTTMIVELASNNQVYLYRFPPCCARVISWESRQEQLHMLPLSDRCSAAIHYLSVGKFATVMRTICHLVT